ncbi:MAG: hypothetical protein LBG72_10340 [Spirochaetaceae bacterium]|jgi:hypothetical protein|nr:hypothetical protein [Spirochaetaceae bacterium]
MLRRFVVLSAIFLLCSFLTDCESNFIIKGWFEGEGPLHLSYDYGSGQIDLPMEDYLYTITIPHEADIVNFKAHGKGKEDISFTRNPLKWGQNDYTVRTLTVTLIKSGQKKFYFINFMRNP